MAKGTIKAFELVSLKNWVIEKLLSLEDEIYGKKILRWEKSLSNREQKTSGLNKVTTV